MSAPPSTRIPADAVAANGAVSSGGAPARLAPARQATLLAAARRLLPPDARDAAEEVVAAAEAKLGTLDPFKRADFGRALDALASRLAALGAVGRATPFPQLSPAQQDRMLAAWERSRIPTLRTAFQALRRLVLALYYARPDAQHRIGYLGPLWERDPAFAWEGAAPALPALPAGARLDAEIDEPIARGGEARDHARWRVPSPASAAYARPGAVLGADALGDGARLTADVVVIGTGAGGAVAAARLAESGRDVVVLEEGPLLRADDFTEREAEMAERLYAEGALRTTDDLGVMMFQGGAVGGGTTINWLVMLRTPHHVLREWRIRYGAWGMTPDELRPVFERIEQEVHARMVPDDAHSPNNRALLDGAARLGWRARAAMINARGCVRSGFCGQGCRYDAKQWTLLTYLPRALAAGARLVPGARADRIELAERGAPNGGTAARALPRKRVTATLAGGGSVTIEAPVVVLGGGAVGTPVLLQRSGMGGGGVGRYLRLHPTTAVTGEYDHDMYAAAGIPLSTLCDEFIDIDGEGYGVWIECPPTHPALMAAATPGFGAEHAERMRHFRRTGTFIVLARDGADKDRSSGGVELQRNGRVSIRYRLTPTDAAHLKQGIDAAARLHLAAGAREALTLHNDPVHAHVAGDLAPIATRPLAPNDLALFSAHVNGTCRMGTDPRTSGATPDGERHGVPGVYVVDGSLLPTALGVNPQETIMAMSTVIAERIVGRW